MTTIVRQRALGALLSWFKYKEYENTTVMLHPLCCDDLKSLLLALNCKLVYTDIDKSTLCSSIDSIENFSDCKIDIFLNVRSFGFNDNMELLFSQVKEIFPNIVIVDDRCLCKPIGFDGYSIKGSADVELYSTGYSKYVDFGWGGYLISKEIIDSEKLYCDFYDPSKIEEGHCFSKAQNLSWVDDRKLNHSYYSELVEASSALSMKHKMSKNLIYKKLLSGVDGITLLEGHSDWRFNILVENPEKIKRKVFDSGFFCSSHYKANCLGGALSNNTPNANLIASKVLNLFNDFRVSNSDVRAIAEVIRHEYS